MLDLAKVQSFHKCLADIFSKARLSVTPYRVFKVAYFRLLVVNSAIRLSSAWSAALSVDWLAVG